MRGHVYKHIIYNVVVAIRMAKLLLLHHGYAYHRAMSLRWYICGWAWVFKEKSLYRTFDTLLHWYINIYIYYTSIWWYCNDNNLYIYISKYTYYLLYKSILCCCCWLWLLDTVIIIYLKHKYICLTYNDYINNSIILCMLYLFI